ncbi:hypothetical protein Dda_5064 [Drechslerella dactyloides]|uniref:Uncharacterized protein n=1 Tax=Drechslerella dactyloides TaxID=74499 RepID=A0AAD6NII6_DREDA|nr:hypothetical protein Dda_5064 [Drechslerella dactyloides]
MSILDNNATNKVVEQPAPPKHQHIPQLEATSGNTRHCSKCTQCNGSVAMKPVFLLGWGVEVCQGGFPAPGAGNLIIRPRGGKLARLNVMPGFTTAATVDFPPAGGLRLGGTLALWGRWLLNHFVYSVAVQDSVSLVYSKRAPMLYTLSFQLPALAQQLICGAKRCVLRAYKRHLVHYRLRPFRQLVHSC